LCDRSSIAFGSRSDCYAVCRMRTGRHLALAAQVPVGEVIDLRFERAQ
jgi:hypothetical protein